MTWIEHRRLWGQYSRQYQDSEDRDHFSLDLSFTPLNYETIPGSGVWDAPINCYPQRVSNAQLDGWRVTQSGWHFALGRPGSGAMAGQDGVVGFGGRQGAHWFRQRLVRLGYLHWPTRAWQDIGGAPTYDQANLSQASGVVVLPTNGEHVVAEALASWERIWSTPSGGQVDLSWRVRGDQLKEEIKINQAGRDWIRNNRPPATPPGETWFGFVLQVDWSDIPRLFRLGALQDKDGDLADDGQPFTLRDSQDRLLAFMPVSRLVVPTVEGERLAFTVRQSLKVFASSVMRLFIREQAASKEGQEAAGLQLRKRLYQENGNSYIMVGIRCDHLAALPAGDLVFDPSLDLQPGAAAGYDCCVRQSIPDTETSTFEYMQSTGQTNKRFALVKFDLSSLVGATITSASLYLYSYAVIAYTATFNIYRILAANAGWLETCTWNYADGAGATDRWAGDSGGDGGSDAGCSVSGTDHASSAMGSFVYTANDPLGTEDIVSLDLTEFGSMLSANHGVLIRTTSTSGVWSFCTSDHATASYRPKLHIEYTVSESTRSKIGLYTGSGL